MKHLRTGIEGSRKRRVYDNAATPFARPRASPQVDPVQIACLETLLATLDPSALKEKIEQKLRTILQREVRRSFAQAAWAARASPNI
jgi:hypothetical protein